MMVRPEQNRTRRASGLSGSAHPKRQDHCSRVDACNKTLAAFSENVRAGATGAMESRRAGIGIAELIASLSSSLADDAEAVANGCSMTWSNGMVEGFVKKVKWIKRSSYGQAGFPLLQRRVRLAFDSSGTVEQRSETPLFSDVCSSFPLMRKWCRVSIQ